MRAFWLVLFASCMAAILLPGSDTRSAFTPSWTQLHVSFRDAAPPTLAAVTPSSSASVTPSPTRASSSSSATAQPATSAAPAATTSAAASFAAQGTPQAATTVPAAPAGWSTLFSDTFDGAAGTAPSTQNWLYDVGTGFGSSAVRQTNSTANAYLDGQGNLVLQANDTDGSWTAAEIETKRADFAAPAGGKLEMTASLELPTGSGAVGYWPAFWAGGTPIRSGGPWPESGEIDMMEDINGLDSAAQTFHFGSSSQLGGSLSACPVTSCLDGFHTYSVVIDRTNTSAESLQFLIDGKVQATYTEAQVGTSTWQAAVDHGYFILLDLVIGGSWPDSQCGCTAPTTSTASGGAMRVGYVAVYEQPAS